MPVSLVKGHIKTGDFTTTLKGTYSIVFDTEVPSIYDCPQYVVLKTHWVVTQKGRVIAHRGFGVARFDVLSQLDTIVMHLSRDTHAVGDTLHLDYVLIQRDGAPMRWPGWPDVPRISGNQLAMHLISRDGHGSFAFLA